MRRLQPDATMTLAVPDNALHLSDRHFRTIAKLIKGQVGIKLPTAKRLMLGGEAAQARPRAQLCRSQRICRDAVRGWRSQ
jgi:hypothetical protein